MPRTLRLLAPLPLAIALAAAGCRRQPPAKPTPPPPPGFGVHVAAAGGDSLHVRFTVTVTGTLKLGIQAPMFAERPDHTLLLAAPANLKVTNAGTGSVIISAADSGVELVATPLDTATTPYVAVRGHVVRFERPDSTQRLTLAAGPGKPTPPEKHK